VVDGTFVVDPEGGELDGVLGGELDEVPVAGGAADAELDGPVGGGAVEGRAAGHDRHQPVTVPLWLASFHRLR
jgi:hypothetical protein